MKARRALIKFRPYRASLPASLRASGAIWVLAMALNSSPRPARAQGSFRPPKNVTLSASAYRAVLQKSLDELRMPRPHLTVNIARRLDNVTKIRRSDGQTQSTSGDFWSDFGRTLNTSKNVPPSELRAEAKLAREALRLQIRALDEWNQAPIYRSVDATKIVAGLAASGQIRVGPLWWQKLYTDTKTALINAWDSFAKWVGSFLPKMGPMRTVSGPSDGVLWFLFYAFITAILGVILWFLWRVFGGRWVGRRASRRVAELEGEDAELLQLPPDELLSRAARFAAQGNFREALRHRYLSLLLDLDARGVWRYDTRRTNWEHIEALNRTPNRGELVAPLSELTRRFDRVRYGGAPCDDSGWQRFDLDARDFETLAATQKAAPVASVAGAERAGELVR